MFVQNRHQLVKHPVPVRIELARLAEGSDILYGNGIGKLIVSQHIPVSVVNIAPCAVCLNDFFSQGYIGILILFSLDDLQLKKPADQHTEHNKKDCGKGEKTGGNHFFD